MMDGGGDGDGGGDAAITGIDEIHQQINRLIEQ